MKNLFWSAIWVFLHNILNSPENLKATNLVLLAFTSSENNLRSCSSIHKDWVWLLYPIKISHFILVLARFKQKERQIAKILALLDVSTDLQLQNSLSSWGSDSFCGMVSRTSSQFSFCNRKPLRIYFGLGFSVVAVWKCFVFVYSCEACQQLLALARSDKIIIVLQNDKKLFQLKLGGGFDLWRCPNSKPRILVTDIHGNCQLSCGYYARTLTVLRSENFL